MIYHQVHNQLHTSFVNPRQQSFKILHSAELIHDIPVVGNIIAIVVIRGFVTGRQPDHINAQFLQIVQLTDDPGQISDPVSVGIHKAAGVDLIYHRLFPPCSFHSVVPPLSLI